MKRLADVVVIVAIVSLVGACDSGDSPSSPTPADNQELSTPDQLDLPGQDQESDLEDEAAAGGQDRPGIGGTGTPDRPASGPVVVEELIAEVAEAVCDALFRCCTTEDQELFFGVMAMSQRIEEAGLLPILPPEAQLTAETCPAAVAAVYEVQPLGPWIDAVEADLVVFDPAAAAACLQTLDNATCGEEVSSALVDSTCFAFAAPSGSTGGRKMFQRDLQIGMPCMPLTDGVGGAFFGTCDPMVSWCCRPSELDPTACSLAQGVEGTCVAAGQVGDACGLFPEISVCRTGLDCGIDQSVCEEPPSAPLSEGQACYADMQLLGDCIDSYCDMFDSRVCLPKKEDGVECLYGWECVAGSCEEGVCTVSSWCQGS